MLPGAQYTLNILCDTMSTSQWNLMFITSLLFCFMVLLMIPSTVLISVFSGTGSCLWPNSSNVIISGTASYALMYNPLYSASAADVITAFITFAKQ